MSEPFIRPDVATFLDAAAQAGAPPLNELPVPVAREAFRSMTAGLDMPPLPLARVSDLMCPSPAGGIPVRLYDSKATRTTGPLILFFHGGGFVFGDLDSHDSFCRFLSNRSELPVLAVDYRLAPEHPFPAFAEDAELVARWAATQPEALGLSFNGLITCGDSAGGHLAILVAQRLGTTAAELPVLAQWAFYPFLGAGNDWPSMRAFGEGYLLTQNTMDWFDALCGKPEGDARYCLLQGPVPRTPLAIQTSGLDPLRDSGLTYYEKAKAAGAPVAWIEAEGMIHGYVNMRKALPSAEQDIERLIRAGLNLAAAAQSVTAE